MRRPPRVEVGVEEADPRWRGKRGVVWNWLELCMTRRPWKSTHLGSVGGWGGGDRGKLEFVLHSWWEVMRNNVIRS